MPGGKQRTQSWKQRERNEDAQIESYSDDSEKSGQGARGGDGSQIAGQTGLAYKDNFTPPKKEKTEDESEGD